MSEITKLYENAKVEREFAYLECHRGRSSICCPIAEYEKDDECMGCINSSAMEEVYKYPPFTAEKQIAILCWLVNSMGYVAFRNKPKDITPERVQEVLAWGVNQYWTKLTPEQQQQIKEILG